MALFHTTRPRKQTARSRKDIHLNWMGGPSYWLDNPLTTLRVAASSCFFGEPMYYHRDASDTRPSRNRRSCQLTDAQRAYLRKTLQAIDPQDWWPTAAGRYRPSLVYAAQGYAFR